MQLPLLSIIIPVFNQWEFTARCLGALRVHTSEIPFEVIVVNNASTDETARKLGEIALGWNALRVITLSANTGFSPACNIGAEAARGELLLFLNNDTEPTPGWLAPLLTELEDPRVGLVGPKLVYPGGLSINHAGYVFGSGAFIGIYHNEPADSPVVNQKRDYQALLGACILLSRQLFADVGGFSLEGLEDIDLCLKVRRQGLACRYVPESVVTHAGSVTLANSAPGTFPVTHATNFAARWTTDDVRWDDYRWYILDGKWPGPPSSSVEGSLALADLSVEHLISGILKRNRGDHGGALSAVATSLAVWDRNPSAFAVWCRMMIDRGERDTVLRTVVKRLPDFSFHPPFLRELLDAIQPLADSGTRPNPT